MSRTHHRAKERSHELQWAIGAFRCLTDCTQVMLKSVEGKRPAPDELEARLFCHLLRAGSQADPDAPAGPTHICAGIDRDGVLQGRLYAAPASGGAMEPVPVSMPTSPVLGRSKDPERASFANAPDEPEAFRRFQNRLGHAVRRQVGVIRNYVATRTGAVVVLAFNFPSPVTELECEIIRMQALHVQFFSRLADQVRATEEAFRYVIHALARASEAHDPQTGNHIVRVGRYAACLAGHMGLAEEFVDTIGYSAQLHDVGKVHLDQHIVRKAGRLEPGEARAMREHTTAGAHIIGPSPRLAMARDIALTHHERWDGSGYPAGLRGEAIPMAGRIVALADVYDALRSPRPYKPAYSHGEAMRIIRQGDGRTHPVHFDPAVLAAVQACDAQLASIYETLDAAAGMD